jgi:hypothetical protein
MRHVKLFEQFLNEGKRGPAYSEQEIVKMKKSLAKGIREEKIDHIDIESVTYQYRINSTEISGKAYSNGEVVGDGWSDFPFDELSEIFRDDIEDGYHYQDDLSCQEILSTIPDGVKVTYNGDSLDPKEGIEIEEGSDS